MRAIALPARQSAISIFVIARSLSAILISAVRRRLHAIGLSVPTLRAKILSMRNEFIDPAIIDATLPFRATILADAPHRAVPQLAATIEDVKVAPRELSDTVTTSADFRSGGSFG
ncbi:hypothetical protein AXW83_05275 [Bosea sp. PAMC 26642]|nr:hypothetical protein AXW83_05275 [Bosea sp. PAMC 26642]